MHIIALKVFSTLLLIFSSIEHVSWVIIAWSLGRLYSWVVVLCSRQRRLGIKVIHLFVLIVHWWNIILRYIDWCIIRLYVAYRLSIPAWSWELPCFCSALHAILGFAATCWWLVWYFLWKVDKITKVSVGAWIIFDMAEVDEIADRVWLDYKVTKKRRLGLMSFLDYLCIFIWNGNRIRRATLLVFSWWLNELGLFFKLLLLLLSRIGETTLYWQIHPSSYLISISTLSLLNLRGWGPTA